jgi:hypothetical protein
MGGHHSTGTEPEAATEEGGGVSSLNEQRLTGREALDLAARVVHDHGGKLDGWLAVCRGAWERVEQEATEPVRTAVAADKEGATVERGMAV